MIRNITADQWKKQSARTIQSVLKQISEKIQREDSELIQPKEASKFEIELKKIMGLNSENYDPKETFHLIVNVLTKIYLVFGRQPFLDQAKLDPLFLFIQQKWFPSFDHQQHRLNLTFLLNGWTSILTQWIKLPYKDQQEYSIS